MSDTLIWAAEAGETDIFAPSAEKAAMGWERGEKPSHQWFNWYMNRTDTRLKNMEAPVTSYIQRWSSSTRTQTILANSRFELPVSYVVGGKHLRVYLDGVLCEPGAAAQYVECGQEGSESTYIRWNDDIDPSFEIRIEVPIRAFEPSRYADNELAAAVEVLKDRVAALEEPLFCIKVDSPANTRNTVINAGTIHVLPTEYTVGANQLQVYVDGVLQRQGTDYEEYGDTGTQSTDIKFLRYVSIISDIRVFISINNREKYIEEMHRYILTHMSKEMRQDVTTTETIAARVEYEVPKYVVGNNSLKVYKNGLLMVNGRDYNEDVEEGVVSTNIFWLASVPTGTLISVIAPSID